MSDKPLAVAAINYDFVQHQEANAFFQRYPATGKVTLKGDAAVIPRRGYNCTSVVALGTMDLEKAQALANKQGIQDDLVVVQEGGKDKAVLQFFGSYGTTSNATQAFTKLDFGLRTAAKGMGRVASIMEANTVKDGKYLALQEYTTQGGAREAAYVRDVMHGSAKVVTRLSVKVGAEIEIRGADHGQTLVEARLGPIDASTTHDARLSEVAKKQLGHESRTVLAHPGQPDGAHIQTVEHIAFRVADPQKDAFKLGNADFMKTLGRVDFKVYALVVGSDVLIPDLTSLLPDHD